ncbi:MULTISPECIES: hypothetical protein [unclassified Streptomyces]|uniref:hypothetical protein n=1 Tax=unclassified Streptomyces TaxID=2593676 RepID=UPI003326CDAB
MAGADWLPVLLVLVFSSLRWIVPALSGGARRTPGGGPQAHDEGSRTARTVTCTAAAASLVLGVTGGPVPAVLNGPLSR